MRQRLLASCAVSLAAILGLMLTGNPSQADSMTVLTIKVANCPSCTVFVTSGVYNGGSVSFQGQIKLQKGTGTISVPTLLTRGLHFGLNTPDQRSQPGAVPVAALKFNGMKAGQKVSTKVALSKRHALPCWAGTTKSAVTLSFIAYRWTVKGDMYFSGKGISFWASPQLPSLPTFDSDVEMQVNHGGLGTQQNFECAV